MTKKEFSILASAMRTFFPKDNLLPNKEAMELWYGMLSDIPYASAEAALKKHVATSKWPPTIADIRQNVTEITTEMKDWSEAWENARRAVRRFGSYQEEEALASLDALTRKAVERYGYRDLCMMEEPEVGKAHFRDIYNAIARRESEDASLPKMLIDTINGLRSGQKLLEGV